ncbi:hypothetical protein C8Q78DRAFT_1078054 [Trametes maxima]|nr:hypothetical protein C8Q78DRAFT_1078054 [Trametes maxima]
MPVPFVSPSALSDPSPLKPLPLNTTVGVLLIGNFLALILYGLNLHQVYRYYSLYPGDSRWLKGLVALALLLETISSVFGAQTCYHYLVTNYFHPEALQSGVWSLNMYPLLGGLAMVVSQSFFARRLWIFEPRYRPAVVLSLNLDSSQVSIVTSNVASVVFIIFFDIRPAATAKMFIINNSDDIKPLARLLPAAFTLALVADLLLTVSLILVLHRSRTGLKRSDTMIDILIKYTINTGLVTGVLDLLTTILAFTAPDGYLYIAFGLPGIRLYAITLLAALNSRKTIADFGSRDPETSLFGVSVGPQPQPSTLPRERTQRTQPQSSILATTDRTNVIELKDLTLGSSTEFEDVFGATPSSKRITDIIV